MTRPDAAAAEYSRPRYTNVSPRPAVWRGESLTFMERAVE